MRRAPIDIDAQTWMYVEPEGLCIVRQLRNPQGVFIQGDMHWLPWTAVRLALAVKDKKRAPRKSKGYVP